MAVLFQLGAVLIAAFVVTVALAATPPSAAAMARSIAVLAVAFGYIAFWGHVWQIGKSFWVDRGQWTTLPRVQADVAGAPLPWQRAAFAEWIKSQLKPGDRFYIVPSSTRNEAVYQWFTFRLLPNLSSEHPKQADWLIFYGTSPRRSGFSNSIVGIAQQYGPGYSIARTRHAR